MPEPLKPRPITDAEKQIKAHFIDAIANQSKLMDSLAQQLLMVELAIPALYATLLKFKTGAEKIDFNCLFATTFIFWLIAIVFTIQALFPKNYQNINRNSPAEIEDFFNQAAHYKREHIYQSLFCFMAGLIALIGNLFV